MPTNNQSDNLFDAQAPLDDEQLWDLLSLYVDGEADPGQAAIVEQMLSSDPAYRRDFDFLMESSKTMHMVEEVVPPASLRDAVYAKTTRRSTLVGRLRAAWDRATTPAFGRYATIGSAFAVAIIGAVIVWPQLNASHSNRTLPLQVAVAPTPHTDVATDTTPTPIRGTYANPKLHESSPAPQPPVRPEFAIVPPLNDLKLPDLRKPAGKSGPQMAIETHPLQNHHLPKNNATHTEVVTNDPKGYPYDPKMDNDKAPGYSPTIVSPKADFGPMVDRSDVTSPTPTPSNGGIQTAMGNTDNVVKDPPAAPKPHVRVAGALPPEISQNIASAVIRHNQTAQYSGYDRNVAENIQRREVVVDVIKGSF